MLCACGRFWQARVGAVVGGLIVHHTADESARKRRTSTRGQEVSDLHELFDEANQQLQETDALLKEAGKPRRGRAARLPESDDEDIEDAEGEDADNQPPRKQPRAAMYNLHAPRFETVRYCIGCLYDVAADHHWYSADDVDPVTYICRWTGSWPHQCRLYLSYLQLSVHDSSWLAE